MIKRVVKGDGSDLVGQIPTLHAKIGTDMFVDCPSELIIELPSDEGHQNASDSHETGNDDQEWL